MSKPFFSIAVDKVINGLKVNEIEYKEINKCKFSAHKLISDDRLEKIKEANQNNRALMMIVSIFFPYCKTNCIIFVLEGYTSVLGKSSVSLDTTCHPDSNHPQAPEQAPEQAPYTTKPTPFKIKNNISNRKILIFI